MENDFLRKCCTLFLVYGFLYTLGHILLYIRISGMEKTVSRSQTEQKKGFELKRASLLFAFPYRCALINYSPTIFHHGHHFPRKK